MDNATTVIVQGDGPTGWTAYDEPIEVLVATGLDRVVPVVAEAERAAHRGLVACGFLAYEAAPAFDPALVTRAPGDLPLAWFALFDPDAARPVAMPRPGARSEVEPTGWTPSLDPAAHAEGIRRIHRWIAAGDTYQVNYTLRLEAPFDGDAAAYFGRLASGHRAGYAAWIDTGRHAICSLSPELFFALDGDRLVARPMKGTRGRGRTSREDREAARRLASSVKDRAENVMIVDMVRNDLGRVARPGSVEVSSLWDVERYPTLFQMTSTCRARTDAALPDILGALFPSASITGAPKVRTMELIRELEPAPRGVYTGTIGLLGPGRRARWNVAIRTVEIDRAESTARYGTGGGIVWDSLAHLEYRECLTKALVVTEPEGEFELLETLRWDPDHGFTRLERHLARLADSADYFDRAIDLEAVRSRLEAAAAGQREAQRVRLLVDGAGEARVETAPLVELAEPRRLALAAEPVDPGDRFLFHKTTRRQVYERALAAGGEADDVLLYNDRGEITESTIANVVVELDGELVTPKLECGLLAGTLRAELLDSGEVRERVIRLDELPRAGAFYLVSSLRGRLRAELVGAETRAVEIP